MRNKVAKQLRRLTTHLDQQVTYNSNYRAKKFELIKNEKTQAFELCKIKGIPKVLDSGCARYTYQGLKKTYAA